MNYADLCGGRVQIIGEDGSVTDLGRCTAFQIEQEPIEFHTYASHEPVSRMMGPRSVHLSADMQDAKITMPKPPEPDPEWERQVAEYEQRLTLDQRLRRWAGPGREALGV